MRHEHRSLLGIRTLCQDRRGALDHFHVSALIKNAIRVTVQQGGLIYSNYMSDQLKHDMALDEDVQKGNLSSHEAEQQTEEWNEVGPPTHNTRAHTVEKTPIHTNQQSSLEENHSCNDDTDM